MAWGYVSVCDCGGTVASVCGVESFRVVLTTDDEPTVFLTLPVGDVLLAGSSKATLDMLNGKLVSRLKMSDMENVSRVLSMVVTVDIQAGSLVFTEKNCTMKLLVKYGMPDWRPLETPGCGKDLHLRQLKEKRLDGEVKRRRQLTVGSAMLYHLVSCKPTRRGDAPILKGSHGHGQASTVVRSWDGGFRHHVTRKQD